MQANTQDYTIQIDSQESIPQILRERRDGYAAIIFLDPHITTRQMIVEAISAYAVMESRWPDSLILHPSRLVEAQHTLYASTMDLSGDEACPVNEAWPGRGTR